MRKSLPIVVTLFLILSISASMFGAEMAPTAASAPAGVVNINTADVAQLSLLPRVGTKAAQRIADYRKEHGPFAKASDLMQVKGFGEKSYERLSAYVTVSGNTTLATKVSSPRKPRAPKASKSHR